MSHYNDLLFLADVFGALQTMHANIDYIEQELPNISSSSKTQVADQCRLFRNFLDQAKDNLAGILKQLKELSQAVDKRSLDETIEDLKDFGDSFRQPLSEMSELANELNNLPPEEFVLFVLVAQAASTILQAKKTLDSSITNTVERLSRRKQNL